jgi:4-carboxymuconolactone decarboxylase
MAEREEILRRMTLGDVAYLDALVSERQRSPTPAELDYAGQALVKLGALTATDGSDLAWQQAVAAALDAGLTADEVVDALVVLAPVIGQTRVMAAAPKVALATGFDVTTALEAH